MYSLLNLFKGYLGISFLAIPYGFSIVGLYGALLGLILVLAINYYSITLLVKTRNKYKRESIRNISDLAKVMYGSKGQNWSDILLVITEISFCVSYTFYFGN